MSDAYDEAVRIVYEDDIAGSLEEHGQAAPSRREALQALLSAQVQTEDSKSRPSIAQGATAACHEPLEATQGAAYRAPLPPPRSPRSSVQQQPSDAASEVQETGGIAAACQRESEPFSPAKPLLPKPTRAELKAEIAASASKPPRSEQAPQRQRYRTPQRQRTTTRFGASWSNNSSSTPISRHVRNLQTGSATGERVQRRISTESGDDGLPVVPSVRRTLQMLQSQSDAQEPQQDSAPEGIAYSSASEAAQQKQHSKDRDRTDAPCAVAPVPAAKPLPRGFPAEAPTSPSRGISAMRRFIAENAQTSPRPLKRIKAPAHSLSGQLKNAMPSQQIAPQAEGSDTSIALTVLARRLEGSLIVTRCSTPSEEETPDLFAVFSTRHGADLTTLTVGTVVAAEPLYRLQLPDGHDALLCCGASPQSTSP